jgi:hypothetical protein
MKSLSSVLKTLTSFFKMKKSFILILGLIALVLIVSGLGTKKEGYEGVVNDRRFHMIGGDFLKTQAILNAIIKKGKDDKYTNLDTSNFKRDLENYGKAFVERQTYLLEVKQNTDIHDENGDGYTVVDRDGISVKDNPTGQTRSTSSATGESIQKIEPLKDNKTEYDEAADTLMTYFNKLNTDYAPIKMGIEILRKQSRRALLFMRPELTKYMPDLASDSEITLAINKYQTDNNIKDSELPEYDEPYLETDEGDSESESRRERMNKRIPQLKDEIDDLQDRIIRTYNTAIRNATGDGIDYPNSEKNIRQNVFKEALQNLKIAAIDYITANFERKSQTVIDQYSTKITEKSNIIKTHLDYGNKYLDATGEEKYTPLANKAEILESIKNLSDMLEELATLNLIKDNPDIAESDIDYDPYDTSVVYHSEYSTSSSGDWNDKDWDEKDWRHSDQKDYDREDREREREQRRRDHRDRRDRYKRDNYGDKDLYKLLEDHDDVFRSTKNHYLYDEQERQRARDKAREKERALERALEREREKARDKAREKERERASNKYKYLEDDDDYSGYTDYKKYYSGSSSSTGGSGSSSSTTGSGSSNMGSSSSNTGSSSATSRSSANVPPGDENLYMLKTQMVTPSCSASPSLGSSAEAINNGNNGSNGNNGNNGNNCRANKDSVIPPCPPCSRCPEPSFDCKKVPNYNMGADQTNPYLPRPVLASFSQFGM